MIDADRWCPCGGELRHQRQKLGQIIVTYLACVICHKREPMLECDTQTNVHRELMLPVEEGPRENTWLPRSLRHRRLQASAVPEGKVYRTLGYEAGWIRVDAGKREAWVAPGGRLLLEALEEKSGADDTTAD